MKLIKSVDWIKVGRVFRQYHGKNNFNNMTYHVRGFVDDEVVVVRWWRKNSYWQYKTFYKADLEFWIKHESLYKSHK